MVSVVVDRARVSAHAVEPTGVVEAVIQVAISSRASVRVVEVRRWTYSTLSTRLADGVVET